MIDDFMAAKALIFYFIGLRFIPSESYPVWTPSALGFWAVALACTYLLYFLRTAVARTSSGFKINGYTTLMLAIMGPKDLLPRA